MSLWNTLSQYSAPVAQLGKSVVDYGYAVKDKVQQEGLQSTLSQTKDSLGASISGLQTTIKQKVADHANQLQEELEKQKERAAAVNVNLEGGQEPWCLPEAFKIYEDELKEAVIQLVEDEANFTTPPLSIESRAFHFASMAPHCATALKCVPGLAQRRTALVPVRISDEKFWQNFYAHVADLKDKIVVDFDVEDDAEVDVQGNTGSQDDPLAGDVPSLVTLEASDDLAFDIDAALNDDSLGMDEFDVDALEKSITEELNRTPVD